MKKLFAAATIATIALMANRLEAIELLSNGDFESFTGGVASPPPGWSLNEFPSSGTGAFDTARQVGFADVDLGEDELGLWLTPFAGGETAPSRLVNAVLSQTVPATAGEGYSFSGWSQFETSYSGGVTTLDPGSPFGAIPSPTRTEMELAFLDTGGNVLGTPSLLDLRTVQDNFAFWLKHDFDQLFGGGSPLVAPTGTTNLRVTAAMYDGAYNVDPLIGGAQSAFMDDFSIVAASNPGTELLVNGNLDLVAADPPMSAFNDWTQTEGPMGRDTIEPQGFAQNSNTAGATGVFLKAFAGFDGLAGDADATLSQTVPGIAGGVYTFTGWSRFEGNYSGGVDNLDLGAPNDPGAPSPTKTELELAFLDGSGTEIGTPMTLDLRTDREAQGGGSANDNEWRQHTIQTTSPAGTALVRVTGSMIDGIQNIDPGQSAFFDDFSLDGPSGPSGLACDFNTDVSCDAADLDLLYANFGGGGAFDLNGDSSVNAADISAWLTAASDPANPYLGGTKTFVLGDVDLDGNVNSADLGLLLNNFGDTTGLLFGAGNQNDDSLVDSADLGLLLNNFGATSAAAAAVPEPSLLPLWLLAILGVRSILSRRQRP